MGRLCVMVVGAFLCSCAAGRFVSVDEIVSVAAPATDERIRIHGYTTLDGEYHKADGYVVLRDDSLRVVVHPGRFLDTPAETVAVIHLEGITSVHLLTRQDQVRSFGAFLVKGVLAVAVLLGALAVFYWLIGPL